MPILKCPKCGKEYDPMYSFHSCKRLEQTNQQPDKKEKKWFVEDIGQMLGIIFVLIVIGVLIWNFLATLGVVEPPGGYISEEEFYEEGPGPRCFMGLCY